MVVFLGPVMLFTWLVTAGLVYAFFPMSIYEALIIGACVSPTDPILANSVITGRFADKYIPHHLRHILSAEVRTHTLLADLFA